MLKLSLIIPVFNEERYMKACLDAVAKQTIMPHEVIVVDNNCSDNTIKIARRYPFVKIIKEHSQGLIPSRNSGFNYAKGDILGRIDADSVINTDWTEVVIRSFTEDYKLQAVTGPGVSYIFPFIHKLRAKYISMAYFLYIEADFRIKVVWGANMALRRSAWDVIKNKVTLQDSLVHEDQDISCWLAGAGLKTERNNNLLISTEDDSIGYIPKFIEYDKRRVKTKKLHKKLRNISKDKRTINNPFKVITGLTVGNIFRAYFWIGGSLMLFSKKIRNKLSQS